MLICACLSNDNLHIRIYVQLTVWSNVCACVCVSENGHQPSKSRPSYNSRIMIMNHQIFGNLVLFSNIVQYQRIVEIPGVKSTIWIWKIKYFSKYQAKYLKVYEASNILEWLNGWDIEKPVDNFLESQVRRLSLTNLRLEQRHWPIWTNKEYQMISNGSGGFLKQGDPSIIHFNRIFPFKSFKPSIFYQYSPLWKSLNGRTG